MIERKPDNQRFKAKVGTVENTYQQAFSGYPWYEDLSTSEVRKRIQKDIQRTGFTAFTVSNEADEIVGGLWYDTPTLEELTSERGERLGQFAANLQQTEGLHTLIWEREVLVRPDFQGRKIASSLRATFLKHLEEEYPEGVLVLTRMRDDNTGILAIAEKTGFHRTGIRMPASEKPDTHHEYWYRIVASR